MRLIFFNNLNLFSTHTYSTTTKAAREGRGSPNSTSEADISSSSDPFTSFLSSPHNIHSYKDYHDLDLYTITLGEFFDYDLLNNMTYFRSYTILRQFINFIIENDIRLSTDEEINGDREWNTATCEHAASIPLKEPRGYSMEGPPPFSSHFHRETPPFLSSTADPLPPLPQQISLPSTANPRPPSQWPKTVYLPPL